MTYVCTKFEKVFVINMPYRADKRDAWALATLYTGLDIEYIDGVDGKDIPAKAYPSVSHTIRISQTWR